MRELITDEMVETAARAMDHAYNPDRAPILAAMFRDYARAALDAAAPLIAATARAETTTDLQMLAEGWDECVKSLRYEDGSPVEIVSDSSPYRKVLEALGAEEAEQ